MKNYAGLAIFSAIKLEQEGPSNPTMEAIKEKEKMLNKRESNNDTRPTKKRERTITTSDKTTIDKTRCSKDSHPCGRKSCDECQEKKKKKRKEDT